MYLCVCKGVLVIVLMCVRVYVCMYLCLCSLLCVHSKGIFWHVYIYTTYSTHICCHRLPYHFSDQLRNRVQRRGMYIHMYMHT